MLRPVLEDPPISGEFIDELWFNKPPLLNADVLEAACAAVKEANDDKE